MIPIDPLPWFLVFVRIGAMLTLFPLTATGTVPARVRVAMAALMAGMIAPLQASPGIAPTSAAIAGAVFVEVGIGVLLGFMTRLTFYAVELAGQLLATEMGLAMAHTVNPLSQAPNSAPGALLFWLAVVLLVATDAHHGVVIAIYRSFEYAPLGKVTLGHGLLQEGVAKSGAMFAVALRIVAPLLAISFIIVLLFSLMARAVPQMNVFSESMPVRVFTGLTVFGLSCQLFAQHIANGLRRIPEDMLRIAQLLGG